MTYRFSHTPPPGGPVDWPAIARFPWVAVMAGVMQEPEWHAEGDVFTHTRMVAEAMAALPAWRECAPLDRDVLFAAALLHDVAKPACTRFEGGRWTSPRHAKVGEGMARRLLWRGEAGDIPPFALRERIAKLVRYHGLPLRFMDKPDPARALILASLEVRLSDVALLATADVIGRTCAGQEQLIASVNAFVEYAQELGCLNGPYPFEHGHHRFSYCVGHKPIDYVPYRSADADDFQVTLMSGLPAGGKSTAARTIAGVNPILSLDQFRQDLEIEPDEDQHRVIAAAKEQALSLLRARRSFVWDATNVTHDLRAGLIALFANYGATTRIVYVEPESWRELLTRNRSRKEPVPERVIERLLEKLEIPWPSEAHEVEYRAAAPE